MIVWQMEASKLKQTMDRGLAEAVDLNANVTHRVGGRRADPLQRTLGKCQQVHESIAAQFHKVAAEWNKAFDTAISLDSRRLNELQPAAEPRANAAQV